MFATFRPRRGACETHKHGETHGAQLIDDILMSAHLADDDKRRSDH